MSLSLPLIYAITFCTVQYGRERQLEEEYAFKSNISISLVPYQELVAKTMDRTNRRRLRRYAAFLIDSVGRVFTSPMEQIFEAETKHRGISNKTIQQLKALLEPLVKLVGPHA